MKITEVEALYLRLPEIQARTDSSQDALLVKVFDRGRHNRLGRGRRLPLRHQGNHRGADIAHPGHGSAPLAARRGSAGDRPPLAQDVPGHVVLRARGGGHPGHGRHRPRALGHQGQGAAAAGHKLLGGGFRKRVRAYASNKFQFTAAATADRAKKARDEGFTAVKFGWEPFGRDARADCAYLDAIRDAVGDEMDIMLDVGLVWDAKTTLQRACLFEPYRLAWITLAIVLGEALRQTGGFADAPPAGPRLLPPEGDS